MRRLKAGFTLIELLVVIAVIAVLIGILLPALGQARQTARGTACLSGMRQVSVGWTIYADENKGVAVAGQVGPFADETKNVYFIGNGYQYRPRWFAMMGASAGFYAFDEPSADRAHEHDMTVTGKVFLCPSVPWANTRNYPYGYNYQFLGNPRFINDDETRGYVNYPFRADRVSAPSGTVLAADCLGTAAGKPRSERLPYIPNGDREPGGRAVGGHGYALDPPRLTPTSDFADTRLPGPEHRSGPDDRHLNKINVSFTDGHCVPMTVEALGYRFGNDKAIVFNGPGLGGDGPATNALFSGSMVDKDPPAAY